VEQVEQVEHVEQVLEFQRLFDWTYPNHSHLRRQGTDQSSYREVPRRRR
jgi:hypothetical protein